MVILSMAEQCGASRSTRGRAFVRELIPGSRAWQRVLALSESSRLGRQAAGGPAPQASRPEPGIARAGGVYSAMSIGGAAVGLLTSYLSWRWVCLHRHRVAQRARADAAADLPQPGPVRRQPV